MHNGPRASYFRPGPFAAVLSGALILLLLLDGLPGAPAPGASPGAAPSVGAPVRAAATACAASGAGCLPAAVPAPHAAGPPLWFNVTAGLRLEPPPVVGGALVLDPLDNYVILFGGCTSSACPAPATTWKYSGGAWTNLTNLSGQPPARVGASFAFDDRDGYALLFGGYAGGGRWLNDTWEFLNGVWTNITGGPAPSPRRGAGLVYDHGDNEMVLFGGCGATCPLADTWRFAVGGWSNLTATAGTAPPARWGAGFAFDAGDNYALLVDGCGSPACPLNDSWSFARNRWAALAPPSLPPARFAAGLAFNGNANATYLVGGNDSLATLADTWKWAAGRWTDATATVGALSSGRAGAALTTTTNSWPGSGPKKWPYFLLFGGTSTGCLPCAAPSPGDTWVFEPLLTATPSALPTVVEIGQPAAFSAVAGGGTAPYIFLWLFGDGSSAYLASVTHAFPRTGSFSVTVNATDAAGVWAVAPVLVTVVPGPAPSGTVRPNPADAGRPIPFLGAATGGTPPYGFRWTFGDGGSALSANATHVFANPGTFAFVLNVTDAVLGYGTWSGTIVVHAALTISVTASSLTPLEGTTVNFTATVGGGTAPATVYWTFGDGKLASGLTASHAYATNGSYTVSATVVDATGAAAEQNLTMTVHVPAPPPPPPPPVIPAWYPWGIVGAAIGTGAVVGALGLARRRRRRHRPPPTPIAAAAVAEEDWERSGAPGASSASRSMRRSVGRSRR